MIRIKDKKGQQYILTDKKQIAVILESDNNYQIRLAAGYSIDISVKEWKRIEEWIKQKNYTVSDTTQHTNNTVKKNGTKA